MKKIVTLMLLIALSTFGFLRNFIPQTRFEADAAHGEMLAPPTPCGLQRCVGLEDDILHSTVRIHLQVWRVKADESGYDLDESVGHATLRGGRALVTHNHYKLLEQMGLPDNSISVVIYDSQGQQILTAPLTDFELSLAADETLVFEMKYEYMPKQLADSGIQSASFADWRTLPLQKGMKVAQIDWDGRVSRVDWTKIEDIITEDGVPRMVLDDGVLLGGSGGGIFWNGMHIANNWYTIEYLDSRGNIAFATSVAPLNEYQES